MHAYHHLILFCKVEEGNTELLLSGTQGLQLLQYMSKHLHIERMRGGEGRGGEGRGLRERQEQFQWRREKVRNARRGGEDRVSRYVDEERAIEETYVCIHNVVEAYAV